MCLVVIQPSSAPRSFDKVQAEIVRRKTLGRSYSGGSVFLLQANLRRLRRLLRTKGVAFHRQVSQGDLAVQCQVRRQAQMRHPTSDGGSDPKHVPESLQPVDGQSGAGCC